MTYDELRVQLDINDPIGVLNAVGKSYACNKWFVVCDEGDCHLLDDNSNECNIREVTKISANNIPRSVKKIVIPDSVTSIRWRTFEDCSRLTSVTIPSSVTSIGAGAFSGCSSLTSVAIPNGVANIEDYAFEDCEGLTNMTISNSVESIGDGAFEGCGSLTSVTIPNSVMSIGEMVFWGCSRLTSVMIGNCVTSIGESAFYGCTNLKDIIFEGKTIEEVKQMENYPWGIKDMSIIKCKS